MATTEDFEQYLREGEEAEEWNLHSFSYNGEIIHWRSQEGKITPNVEVAGYQRGAEYDTEEEGLRAVDVKPILDEDEQADVSEEVEKEAAVIDRSDVEFLEPDDF